MVVHRSRYRRPGEVGGLRTDTDGSAWKLTEVKDMAATRRAIIHGRSCVEIEMEEQRRGDRDGLLPLNHDPEKLPRHTRVWAAWRKPKCIGSPSRA